MSRIPPRLSVPLLAHRDISWPRSNSVAFGAKRTFGQPRLQNRIYEDAPWRRIKLLPAGRPDRQPGGNLMRPGRLRVEHDTQPRTLRSSLRFVAAVVGICGLLRAMRTRNVRINTHPGLSSPLLGLGGADSF